MHLIVQDAEEIKQKIQTSWQRMGTDKQANDIVNTGSFSAPTEQCSSAAWMETDGNVSTVRPL